jgi:hypothetical protein
LLEKILRSNVIICVKNIKLLGVILFKYKMKIINLDQTDYKKLDAKSYDLEKRD